MRKLLVLLVVLGVAMWAAASASATIHPLVCSENSAAPSWTPAITQDPPGLTGQGGATIAQPVVAIQSNSTTSDLAAFKPPGC